ncbi:MAG: hypothetical protein S4CHLAM102_07420 [Chlamydiia bacterium]|nr:hypothetical protein [Chlamydiia bacterium]
MFKNSLIISTLIFPLAAICHAEDQSQNEPLAEAPALELSDLKQVQIPTDGDMPTIAEAFGHLIGKNLDALGLDFDITKVLKGIEDSFAGKAAPMTESECVQAITLIQEGQFQKQAHENLQIAESFMEENAKKEGVVSLDDGKLQYKQLASGEGAVVEAHNSPTIRYTGRFIDGNVFGASSDDEVISLDETIAGFSKALVGMKEGEKREIYIHPELGYGTAGYLPPNTLLTFEIEVVKANTAQPTEEAIGSAAPVDLDHANEIAIPNDLANNSSEAIR